MDGLQAGVAHWAKMKGKRVWWHWFISSLAFTQVNECSISLSHSMAAPCTHPNTTLEKVSHTNNNNTHKSQPNPYIIQALVNIFMLDLLTFNTNLSYFKFISCFVVTDSRLWLHYGCDTPTYFHTAVANSCISGVLPTAAVPVWHPVPECSGRPAGSDPSFGPLVQWQSTQRIQTSRDGSLLCTDQGQKLKHVPVRAQRLLHTLHKEFTLQHKSGVSQSSHVANVLFKITDLNFM